MQAALMIAQKGKKAAGESGSRAAFAVGAGCAPSSFH
jgi:hypothetical protein